MISALEAARRIADALEAAELDYAVGGAIAYGYWSEPRGTKDVDVNLFIDEPQFGRLFDALRRAGCVLDEASALTRIEREGIFVATLEGMRIDVFPSSVPYHDVAKRTRVRIDNLRGRPAWILSAEAACVFKLMFFRGKDLGDVEQLVAARGAALDWAHVRSALIDMVGDDDPRVGRWDEIVRVFGHGRPPRGTPAP